MSSAEPHHVEPPTSREPATVERRAHRRALLDRPVLLESSRKTTTARSVNVCAGGIAIHTELDLGDGEAVGVYFELPIGYGVELRARVLRREGAVTVLSFVDGPREALLAIRSFCRISGLQPAQKA